MDLYTVIPLESYNKYEREEHTDTDGESTSSFMEHLEDELSQKRFKKAKSFLAGLKEEGIVVDREGYLGPNEELPKKIYIMPYLHYALTGKDKPRYWREFSNLISKCRFARYVLSKRAELDIKKARRNGAK